MQVLAFDRDWTVDLNPHPNHRAVPLDWVHHWAHHTNHEVWAIGNQDLVYEAGIPGVVEIVRRYHGDLETLGEQDENGRYESWPSRERRLELLSELFPDATNYIVIDDLDLEHVEGWEHYHAWEFIDALEKGSSISGLSTPSNEEKLSPSRGNDTDHDQKIRNQLEQASEVKVRLDDEREDAFRSRSWKEGRPSASPPGDPRPMVFTTDSGETIRAKVSEIAEIEVCRMASESDDDRGDIESSQLDSDTIPDPSLMLGRAEQADCFTTTQQVEFAINLLKLRTQVPAFSHTVAETFLDQVEGVPEEDRSPVVLVIKFARNHPMILSQYIDELGTLARLDNEFVRQQALRCLVSIVEYDPQDVLDAVPTFDMVLEGEHIQSQKQVVYILSRVSESHPESVLPILDTLLERIAEDNQEIQINALAAVGHIASEYPNTVDKIVDTVAPFLSSDATNVNMNVVGLMADIAREYPESVVQYTDEITQLLEHETEQVRINASIALLNAGKANPERIRKQQEAMEAGLEDPTPAVRANVCTLIGNADVDVDIEKLEELATNDSSNEVREQASWALERLR